VDLWALDDDYAADIMQAAILVGRAIKHVMRPDGMNLITSAGQAATQSVFHLHLHVVPRWMGDHVGEIWPPNSPWPDPVKDEIAELVRNACSNDLGGTDDLGWNANS